MLIGITSPASQQGGNTYEAIQWPALTEKIGSRQG